MTNKVYDILYILYIYTVYPIIEQMTTIIESMTPIITYTTPNMTSIAAGISTVKVKHTNKNKFIKKFSNWFGITLFKNKEWSQGWGNKYTFIQDD